MDANKIIFITFLILLVITSAFIVYLWQESDDSIAPHVKTGLTVGLALLDVICLVVLGYLWYSSQSAPKQKIVMPYPASVRTLLGIFALVFFTFAIASFVLIDDTMSQNISAGTLAACGILSGSFFFIYSTSDQSIYI